MPEAAFNRPYLRTGARWRVLLLIVVFLCTGFSVSSQGQEGFAVGIVYPKVRSPYDRVFAEIIEGITREVVASNGSVDLYELPEAFDKQAVLKRLKQSDARNLIVLGKRGFNLIDDLADADRIFVGAVNAEPDTNGRITGGISLSPDPEVLFGRLRKLDPKANKVFVVYNPGVHNWMIRKAREAARTHGLELDARPALSLKESARHFRSFTEAATDRDAVWILRDPTVFDSKTILPQLLEEAWDRRFAVFSANPSQVSKGVLFALYPDNDAMGRRLGEMVVGSADSSRKPGVQLLQDVMIAVNTRTARRLGLRFSIAEERAFDLVFPNR